MPTDAEQRETKKMTAKLQVVIWHAFKTAKWRFNGSDIYSTLIVGNLGFDSSSLDVGSDAFAVRSWGSWR